MSAERRARVQASNEGSLGCPVAMPNGTVAWWEHELAWRDYDRRYNSVGHPQTAERLAERGGFSYAELVDHLGRPPITWAER